MNGRPAVCTRNRKRFLVSFEVHESAAGPADAERRHGGTKGERLTR